MAYLLGPASLGAACLAAALACGAGTASAASFNCNRATTVVERAVCSDPELSDADERLSALYQAGLDQTGNSPRLIEGQRTWMRNRDGCPNRSDGPDELQACLMQAYAARQDALSMFGRFRKTQPY